MTRRFVATLFAVAVACVDQGERPPPQTCSGRCVDPRPGPVGHAGSAGSAGAGGESGTGDEPVRLVGDVALLINIPAFEATDYVESADIVVKGQDGDLRGRWNGSDPFSIDGVERRSGIWVEATPLGGAALRTVQPIDTSEPNAAGVVQHLLVVSASEIDLALGAISSPLTPNPARAQVVLIAEENEEGLSGVRVSAPGAEAVIYLDNGAYTDTATETDSSGIVVIANVPPDSSYTVTLSGAMNRSAELRLVSGGVTVGVVPK